LFQVDEYIGLDIDSERTRAEAKADFLYDGQKFPFEAGSFDSILCNQVLEHVFNPEEFIKEIHRVLKPNGVIILTVPFMWDEHEQPFDYARYSSFGLKALIEKNGFIIEKQKKINPNLAAIFQLFICYFYKFLPKPLIIRLIINAIIFAPISLLGIVLGKLLPNNQNLYLDQIILAKKTP
jgi:SAM-dependent methyltransferase